MADHCKFSHCSNHSFKRAMGSCWPSDVGIVGMYLVVPSTYVDQTELESFDGVSTGKYTVGLGQLKMGFCTDREDINSLCLTALSRLVDSTGISYADIGRLEVGTETIVDKSKSVKTVLMQLFEESGNFDVEGIDTTNACYGGTAAFTNALSWVESSAWDGRYAVVLAADIAIYAKGNARPTGGAGAVAMLIGPNAPLVIERGLRSTFMRHAYDFYKPDLASEYPVVDGKLSIKCYLSALDECYRLYCAKARLVSNLTGDDSNDAVGINSFDAMIFHAPYGKLVQKSLARMVLNDFVSTPDERIVEIYPGLEKFIGVRLEDTYFDRAVEKSFLDFSLGLYKKKTEPSLLISRLVGNMYTCSLYGGLVSYLISKPVEDIAGQRIGMFSYGSGLASTMFSIKVVGGDKLNQLTSSLRYVHSLLESRKKVSPLEFSQIMEIREKNHHRASYSPVGDIGWLFPNTWYLKEVDESYRRTYDIVKVES